MIGHISSNKITIPKEIRDKAGIVKNCEVDISYDEETNSVIISLQKDEIKKVEKVKNVEKVVTPKKQSKGRKIVANYQDAEKLYRTSFSDCGLVVRTKQRYIDDFCKDCRGQLAKENSKMPHIICKYLDNVSNVETEDKKPDKKTKKKLNKKKNKETEEKVENKELTEIKNQRKQDYEQLSKSIKEATKVLDNNIKDLTSDEKVNSKQRVYGTSATEIKPVKAPKGMCFECAKCNQYYDKGFLLDDIFLCKECTVKDFKRFMRKRGK